MYYVGTDRTLFPYRCQFAEGTADGKPDENASENCGETSASMTIMAYGGAEVLPDVIKDAYWGQNRTGVVSYPSDISNYLSRWGGLSSQNLWPTTENGWNGSYPSGLLSNEWYYLSKGMLLLGNFIYVDNSGVEYPSIGHWRVIVGQDQSYVYTADPAISVSADPTNGLVGARREDYATHWRRFNKALVPVTQPLPA